MSLLLRKRVAALGVILGATAALTIAAQPAEATAINCTYSHNGATIFATCDNTNPYGEWYLKLTCQRYGNDHLYYAKGTLAYGSSRSQANCGTTGEVIDDTIVNLT
ncbi:hypothetical protein ACIGXA_06865 [Streptomyces fildesensis]|uniref:Cyanovirin-N domain-containing protein n=1 Tax=Streptomyces fildesensis TaxID=375757 RepID=A0ABW8C1D0_9ACTN